MSLPTGRALLDANKILQRVGLGPNMNFADLGAGTLGHLVLPASQIVGENGRVYAVDILKSALEAVKSRAQLLGVHNLETVWGDIEKVGGVKIPPQSLNLISCLSLPFGLILKAKYLLFLEGKYPDKTTFASL